MVCATVVASPAVRKQGCGPGVRPRVAFQARTPRSLPGVGGGSPRARDLLIPRTLYASLSASGTAGQSWRCLYPVNIASLEVKDLTHPSLYPSSSHPSSFALSLPCASCSNYPCRSYYIKVNSAVLIQPNCPYQVDKAVLFWEGVMLTRQALSSLYTRRPPWTHGSHFRILE